MYIILFLHQSKTGSAQIQFAISCISSYSYIKPQPLNIYYKNKRVVYHPIPTSNHNSYSSFMWVLVVVYHPIPTSNHNCLVSSVPVAALYIILFLHQTTTAIPLTGFRNSLYIILFLHQTTTNLICHTFIKRCISSYSYIKPQPVRGQKHGSSGCISSYSYIKPQPLLLDSLTLVVVYHPIPTSNHNLG